MTPAKMPAPSRKGAAATRFQRGVSLASSSVSIQRGFRGEENLDARIGEIGVYTAKKKSITEEKDARRGTVQGT